MNIAKFGSGGFIVLPTGGGDGGWMLVMDSNFLSGDGQRDRYVLGFGPS